MKNLISNILKLMVILLIANNLYPAISYVDILGTDDGSHGTSPGVNAYRTIVYAINAVSAGDTIIVGSGIFAENLTINKSIFLLGPNHDKTGYDPTRISETELCRSSAGTSIITVSSNNVYIAGFTIDGNLVATSNKGIMNDFSNSISSLVIKNNVIRDISEQGIHLDGPGTLGSHNFIEDNYIVNVINEPGEWQMTTNHSIVGRGVVIQNNIYTNIKGNLIEDVFQGIYTRTFSQTDTCYVDSNIIYINANNITDGAFFSPAIPSKPGLGITNYQHSGNSFFYIRYNTIKKYNSPVDTYCNGISCIDIYDDAGIYYYYNTIDEMLNGYSMYNCPTNNNIVIRGGSVGADTIKNKTGVGFSISNVIVDDMGAFFPNYSYAANSIYNIDSLIIKYSLKWGIYEFGQDNASAAIINMNLFNSIIQYTQSGESDHANIYLYDNRNNIHTTIDNCEISNSQNRGITITGSGTVNVTNCNIHDNSSYGIMLRNRDNATANITNNKCYNNSVHVNLDYATTSNTNNLFNNSFTGSGWAIRNYRNAVIDIVNASCNWFDGNTEIDVTSSFSSMVGYVDYSPWLHNNTNISSLSGFESDMMELNISYSSLNVSGEGYASEAMNYLANNGTIYLKDGSYSEILNVSKSCVINNGGTSNIDCIKLGSFGCTLNLAGNLTLNDSIVCDSACINAGTDTLILSSTGIIRNENSTSHIDGYIATIRTIGTGGNSFGNIGVNINSGADNLGNVSVVRNSGSGAEVTFQSISKTWHIESDNPPTAGRGITFNWLLNDDNGINLANVYLMSSPDNSSPSSYILVDGPFDAIMGGRIVNSNVNSLSYWTIADDNSLPIQSISCLGYAINGEIVIDWRFEGINNNNWIINRRKEHSEFKPIGTMPYNKTSFIDMDINNNTVYYYKITDQSGKILSNEIKVISSTNNNLLGISCKQNDYNVNIEYTLPKNDIVKISIYDITGKYIAGTSNIQKIAGKYTVNYSLDKFSSGIYFVRMSVSSKNILQKILILK